ncbi:MAG: hypothetical protein N3G19_00300 [Candidatus Pacearchaeota archaeon]|nr:hypothetical protein [Candidatus Pacearchaeota archaeon]
MVEIDLSGISAFVPIFGFLLVFAVVYALLGKTKVLGENKFVHIFVSFAVAIVFLVSANAIEYVRVVTPWFAAFIVSLLFIALVVGLIKGNVEEFFKGKGFAWFVIIVLIAIFVFSAIYVFADVINKYLGQPKTILLQPQIVGVLVLIGLTIFISWLLTKK